MALKNIHLKWVAFMLGIHATVSQVVLMREFFLLFEGNDLSSGLFLGYWLAIGAVGAHWGGNCKLFKPSSIYPMLLTLALGPMVSLLLIACIQRFSDPSLPFLHLALSGLVVVPPAFFGGMSFSWLAGAFSLAGDKKPIGNVYILDQLGSAAIGILLYLWMLTELDAFQLITVHATIAFVLYSMLLPMGSRPQLQLIMATCLVAMALLNLPVYLSIRNWAFAKPHAKITKVTDTPFGQLWTVDICGTRHWYENGQPVATYNSMLKASDTLCGSTGPILILTHGIPSVDEPLHDRTDIYTFNKSLAYTLQKPNAITFLQSTTNQYQCVIITQSESTTICSHWFIEMVTAKLEQNGSIHIIPIAPKETETTALAFSHFFNDVNIDPSNQYISCKNQKTDTALIDAGSIWSPEIRCGQTPRQHKRTLGIGLIIALGIAIVLLIGRRNPKIIFLTGMSASALQVGLWHFMQLLSGFAYNYTGLAIVLFMTMLSLGAYACHRNTFLAPKHQSVAALAVLSIVNMASTAASMFVQQTITSGLWVLVPVAISGIATGYLFASIATFRPFNNRQLAGELYAMDVMGGAAGAFAMGLVVIPVFGLWGGHWFALAASISALAIVLSPSTKP
jgi:hypothetical protein